MNAPTQYNPTTPQAHYTEIQPFEAYWRRETTTTTTTTTPPTSATTTPHRHHPHKPLPHQLPPKKRFMKKCGANGGVSSDPLLHSTVVTIPQKPLAHQLPLKKRFCHQQMLSPESEQQQQHVSVEQIDSTTHSTPYRSTYKLLDDFSIVGGVGWLSDHSASSSLCSSDEDDDDDDYP